MSSISKNDIFMFSEAITAFALIKVGMGLYDPMYAATIISLGTNLFTKAFGDISDQISAGTGQSGTMNHDIQRALNCGFHKAINLLEKQYRATTSYQHHTDEEKGKITLFFKYMRDRGSIESVPRDNPITISEEFLRNALRPGVESNDLFWDKMEIDLYLSLHPQEFVLFYKKNIIEKTMGYFREELKVDSPTRTKAYRAFDMLVQEIQISKISELQSQEHAHYQDQMAALDTQKELLISYHKELQQILRIRTKLNKLCELEKWVRSHFGELPQTPKLEEFLEETLFLPDQYFRDVFGTLQSSKYVLMEGRPASGKSIIGIGIGFEWNKYAHSECYIIDFKDESMHDDRDLIVFKNEIDLLTPEQNILIIIDNIHINKRYADKMVRYIQDNAPDMSILCINRISNENEFVYNSMKTNKNLIAIRITDYEESFICTAKRRLFREGIEDIDFTPEQVANWIKACGCDLVIFAIAFNPAAADELDYQRISQIVRENYIIPASSEKGGITDLLDICVMNAIEINFSDQLWKDKFVETQLKDLYDTGILEKHLPQYNSTRGYYRVFHPSLACLILKVYSNDEIEHLWISRVTTICVTYPGIIFQINERLKTNKYEEVTRYHTWKNNILQHGYLLDRFFSQKPHISISVIDEFDYRINWSAFVPNTANGSENLQDALISSLMKIGYGHMIIVLNYIVGQCNEVECAQELLNKTLCSPELIQVINSSPICMEKLYDYMEKMGYGDRIPVMLEENFANNEFKNRLLQLPVNSLFDIITYLEKKKHNQLSLQITDKIIPEISQGIGYYRIVCNTSASDDIPLFDYLVEHRQRFMAKQIVLRLLKDEHFYSFQSSLPIDHLISFLQMADYLWLFDDSKQTLERIIADPAYLESIESNNPDSIVSLFKYLDYHRLHDQQEKLLDVLRLSNKHREVLHNSSPSHLISIMLYYDRFGFLEFRSEIIQEIVQRRINHIKCRKWSVDNHCEFYQYLSSIGKENLYEEIFLRFCESITVHLHQLKLTGWSIVHILSILAEIGTQKSISIKDRLLDSVIHNRDITRNYLSKNLCHNLLSFSEYLAGVRGMDAVQEHFHSVERYFSLRELETMMHSNQHYDIYRLLNYIEANELTIKDEIKALFQKAMADDFTPTRAHADYPQVDLMEMTTLEFINLLYKTFMEHGRYASDCLGVSLVSDKDSFFAWLAKFDNAIILNFIEYLERYHYHHLLKHMREFIRKFNVNHRDSKGYVILTNAQESVLNP